jgi:prepilin-type N-terminal cleavage/methylation domain-containing protein
MRKRHPFSLVELLIALVLLAVCAGMAVLKIRQSVQERQVHTTCEIVRGTVHLAARLSKLTHGEVRMQVFEENGKSYITIKNDLKVSAHLKTSFTKKRLLTGVVDFDVTTSHYDEKSGIFSFFPWGLDDPETTLNLSFESGKKASCPIAEYIVQAEQDQSSDAREHYPYEVLQDEQEASQIHIS